MDQKRFVEIVKDDNFVVSEPDFWEISHSERLKK